MEGLQLKITMGFVSNSSSSSFVLIGQFIGDLDSPGIVAKVDAAMEEGRDVILLGDYLDGGRDVMDLTAEIWDYVKKRKLDLLAKDIPFTFMTQLYTSTEGDATSLPACKLVDKLKLVQGNVEIVHGDMDQNSCTDVESFKDQYFYGEDEQDG